jgi:ribosomal protein S18 acetylase RimI-like enzyme
MIEYEGDFEPVNIREFQNPQDYPEVIALWQSAGEGIQLRQSDQPEEIHKKLLRDPDLFLVAELDGRILGTVLGGFDGRRGMMYHLAVNQGYRKKGIATKLVDELELRLRAKGCMRYYLIVFPDNQDAISFYEANGWKRMPLHAYGKDLN